VPTPISRELPRVSRPEPKPEGKPEARPAAKVEAKADTGQVKKQ
jgi:hypothetical protein